ncbi:MAG TPA: tetratricopeptide repeat protein [Thermoanaerobaculia bacterium]|nr:tetratricopeptide repeat protein [Thermoanaerobaculia bacterium]
MKKKLCLFAALTLSVLLLTSCQKVQARMEIRNGNTAYQGEDYKTALGHYTKARQIDPNSFPDLDRLIGYSRIGMYVPDDKSPANEQNADLAVAELRKYLRKRPDDQIAREALINLYLNANRTTEAVNFFREYLQRNPADLPAVRSIAQLYAKQGDFNESLNWYEKITLLDSKNPEAFYIFGVVCYEKVAKNPPADPAERLAIIEKGKLALQRSINMKADYSESMAYLNLLYRQQALVETDPEVQQELLAKADAIRNQAIEIIKQRKAASAAQKKD